MRCGAGDGGSGRLEQVAGLPSGVRVPDAAAAVGGLVNLDTATLAELHTLLGIGEVLAQRFVGYGDRRGGFRAVTGRGQVEGVGAAFGRLEGWVMV